MNISRQVGGARPQTGRTETENSWACENSQTCKNRQNMTVDLQKVTKRACFIKLDCQQSTIVI